jgi:hypothetical protein
MREVADMGTKMPVPMTPYGWQPNLHHWWIGAILFAVTVTLIVILVSV